MPPKMSIQVVYSVPEVRHMFDVLEHDARDD